MSINEALSLKYAITKDQAELLERKLGNVTDVSELDDNVVLDVTNILMLTQKLTGLGFEPNLNGCEKLVSCIPSSMRTSYSENLVQAAIEYVTKMDSY